MSTKREKHATQLDLENAILFNQLTPSSTHPVERPARPEPSPANRLTKRKDSSTSPKYSGKVISGQPRELALPQASKAQSRTAPDLVVRKESPWDTFEKGFDCELDTTVAVVSRRPRSSSVFAIRRYPGKDADEILQYLGSVRHENVLSATQCFRTEEALYTVGEFDPLTLGHIVACKAYPNERQLSAIMTQVVLSLF